MRKVTLEEIYYELQDQSSGPVVNPRLNMLIEEMRSDLNRNVEPPDKVQDLNRWWEKYRGLSTYIYR